ncbi:MAG: hypothetical protein LC708_03580, partial [Actinobacteria bacterium]|nr:hypothetical protein [Actinomycetota bacterium]
RYNPLTPARILDTRDGTGAPAARVGSGSTTLLQVTGRGGVPATGVTAVAMNVAVTNPSALSFLTLYPSGQPQPVAANLNFVAGQTVSNLVVAKVGGDGKVAIFNYAGSTDVIADVAGWYGPPSTGNDGRLQPLNPTLILDSRNGTGGGVRLGPGQTFDMTVAGVGGVPATGAEAAVLNIEATNPDAQSFFTAYPTGEARPLAGNLNWVSGLTVSNRAIVKLGAGGKVTLYNFSGNTDVVVDVNGWYTDATVAGATGNYGPVNPSRIVDTRDGTGGISGPVVAGAPVDIQVAGQGGVPASGASAVILNVTVTQPSVASTLTLFPTGGAQPGPVDMNFAAGENRGHLVVVKLGAGGKVTVSNQFGSAHVVIDVAGWVT